MGSPDVPPETLALWQKFTDEENYCLTWGGTSPNSQDILNHVGDFWVKCEVAQSGKSLLVLEQILVEEKHDEIMKTITRKIEEL